jgi:hypothetical protein
MATPNTHEGQRLLHTALQVLQHLGVPVATEKTEGPATSVTFLGVLIDTQNLELRLPSDKLSRLQALVSDWQKKHTCTRKELESLLGHLSHAATVVQPGRTFLRSLFSLLHVAKAPHHFIRLDKGSRADLAWWRCFLQRWNGSSFLPLPTPAAHVHSDASGNYGCGAFSTGLDWFQIQWPQDWACVDISAKELVPVVLAGAIWGSL